MNFQISFINYILTKENQESINLVILDSMDKKNENLNQLINNWFYISIKKKNTDEYSKIKFF